jgi:hypothetical protein
MYFVMDSFFYSIEAINCHVVIPEWTVNQVNFLSFDASIDFSRGLVIYSTFSSCIKFYKSREHSILNFVNLNFMLLTNEDNAVLFGSKGHTDRVYFDGTQLLCIFGPVYFYGVVSILNGKIMSDRGCTYSFNSSHFKRFLEVLLLPVHFPEIASHVDDQEVLVILGEKSSRSCEVGVNLISNCVRVCVDIDSTFAG